MAKRVMHVTFVQASRISSFENRHRQLLAALPDSMQEAYATRRKKASSVPGFCGAYYVKIYKLLGHT